MGALDVLYWSMFQQLGIPESQIEPFLEPLINFVGETTDTIGYAHLLTTFKDKKVSKSIMIKYLIVNACTSYNAFIGPLSLNELGAIISTFHLRIKFLSENGMIIVV